MKAAEAHVFIDEHRLEDRVANLVADAPELTSPQRQAINAIFPSINGGKPAPQPAPRKNDTDRPRASASG